MKLILVPLSAFLLGAAYPAIAQPADPAGEFKVVDLRRAGDVSGGPVDESVAGALGAPVHFGKTLVWWDGSRCDDWSISETDAAPVNLADPILSDTQVPPVDGPKTSGDRRGNRPVAILCKGKPFAGFTQVDRRVIIAPSPSGQSYLVIERPLPAAQIRQFQSQLRSMKFFDRGPTDAWDGTSLRAVSAYADYRGAEYAFNRAAITENLLDGLGVLEPVKARELVKLVYSGSVAAYFYGEERELVPRSYGVSSLAFRFEGDDREYEFKPEGELFATDWSFDVFSPDGAHIVLLQDRFGPLHVVSADHLKAYLRNESEADYVVGKLSPAGQSPTVVHRFARWLSNDTMEYVLACCGGKKTVRWRVGEPGGLPYVPGDSGASMLQYRPGIAGKLDSLPRIRLEKLTEAIIHLGDLNRHALQNPGHREKGKFARSSNPTDYVPSDEELRAAEFGDRLIAFMSSLEADQIAAAWTGAAKMPGPVKYRRFIFYWDDIKGGGRAVRTTPPLQGSIDFSGR